MKCEGTGMLDSKSVTEAEAKACPRSLSLWIFIYLFIYLFIHLFIFFGNTFPMGFVRQKTSTD